MAAAVVLRPPWCPTPGAETFDNQPTCWATFLCSGSGCGAPWRPQSTIFMSRRVDGRSFFLWFVSYVGIRRTHTGKSVMPSRHRVRKSIIIAGIGARRLGSLQAESAVQPRLPVRHTVKARCVAAAASEKAGEEEYEAFFYNMKKNASIDHGGRRRCTAAHGAPLPAPKHTTQSANMLRDK